MDDIKAQLEKADKELQEELDKWHKSNMNPMGWRMQDAEIQIRAEILVLIEIVKEHLDVSQEELNVLLKRKLKEMLESMYPEVNKMRRDAIRQNITKGIDLGFGPNHN